MKLNKIILFILNIMLLAPVSAYGITENTITDTDSSILIIISSIFSSITMIIIARIIIKIKEKEKEKENNKSELKEALDNNITTYRLSVFALLGIIFTIIPIYCIFFQKSYNPEWFGLLSLGISITIIDLMIYFSYMKSNKK